MARDSGFLWRKDWASLHSSVGVILSSCSSCSSKLSWGPEDAFSEDTRNTSAVHPQNLNAHLPSQTDAAVLLRWAAFGEDSSSAAEATRRELNASKEEACFPCVVRRAPGTYTSSPSHGSARRSSPHLLLQGPPHCWHGPQGGLCSPAQATSSKFLYLKSGKEGSTLSWCQVLPSFLSVSLIAAFCNCYFYIFSSCFLLVKRILVLRVSCCVCFQF